MRSAPLVLAAAAAWREAGGALSCEPRITGVIDGPLAAGTPKAVELYFPCTVLDASAYGLASVSASDGSGGPAPEAFLSGCVQGDTFVHVASEAPGFTQWFGFEPRFLGPAAAEALGGHDAVVLFANGSAVDTFGVVGEDGTNTLWEYLDGWAYRMNDTAPYGAAFEQRNWTFSGKNALDGDRSNAAAFNPFPARSYRQSAGTSDEPCPQTTEPPCEQGGSCSSPAPSGPGDNIITAEEEEGQQILYLVVIVALVLAMCLAAYTVMSLLGKKVKKKFFNGDGAEDAEQGQGAGSVYGRPSRPSQGYTGSWPLPFQDPDASGRGGRNSKTVM